ncbi:Alpha/beta hydrolase family protein [Geodermatophilus amargosae]|uniref:Alpha/beta hydrolase family protein n=1 Tax=Geodermatophilus amargosae TaxID=1296565 RepID=A0A1I7C513_9ACTN|nr:alpha/beta hydrolase [Geodermatophilus amargosae]SFT94530.1 Alpha/beta hydrolase family protein [Geodermatophilus amargosae]
MTPAVVPYGPHPDQFLELTLPDGDGPAPGGAAQDPAPGGAAQDPAPGGSAQDPAPVVVVLHGGFWRAAYGIELARPLAADLAAAGYAAVAVEYRRVGTGGGWPATLEDVAAALDALPGLPDTPRLDLGDVTVVGHSAGGHLAAWAAGRGRLPAGAPGAAPRVRVTAAVLQAGVVDLQHAAQQRLGERRGLGAVQEFLGGEPGEVPDRYAVADPVRLLPTGADVLCVHGTGDDVVPLEQSQRYAAAAAGAGDRVTVRTVPGGHRVPIDVAGEAWAVVREWLGEHTAGRRTGTTLGP